MKQRPILFSTEMVQAILDGRKTMTRRIIKKPFSNWITDQNIKSGWGEGLPEQCPYGQPGDILWVREKFRPLYNCETGEFVRMDFYADMPAKFHQQYPHTYKPSIHMPKAAARIWLQVEAVRVERLQDITYNDALAEGIQIDFVERSLVSNRNLTNNQSLIGPVGDFQTLWQSINGPESWEQNPWVWVVSFKVLSTTGTNFSKPKP